MACTRVSEAIGAPASVTPSASSPAYAAGSRNEASAPSGRACGQPFCSSSARNTAAVKGLPRSRARS
jgi:hypothetical protein